MGRPYPIHVAAELAGPQPPPPVAVEAMEVTQVVQNLRHDVPLVANKKTLLRCYLSVPAGTPSVACRGEVRLMLDDGVAFQASSMNTVMVAPLGASALRPLREDLARSLNFLLPDGACQAGNLTIRLDSIIPEGFPPISPGNGSSGSLKVAFSSTPPLRVKLFSIRHTSGIPAQTYLPSTRDRQLTISWLSRAYPTPTVISSHTVINAPKPWPFTCDDVNLQLAAIRRQDMAAGGDPRTHYYGLVSDGGGRFFMRGCAADIPDHPAPDTVASGPAGPEPFGWDRDGSYADWYTGHELGHTFGRFHPGFCSGNSADDPNYPFSNGKLANPDGEFVGLDVGDADLGIAMTALPGVTWADVMTYCEFQWMCSYTLGGIHQRLRDEDAAFAGPLPDAPTVLAGIGLPADGTALIHVLASLDLVSGAGKIMSVQPVDRGVPSRPTPDSPAVVELLDATGQTLLSHPLRIKKSSCCEGEGHEHGMIDALLPAPPQARRVQLIFRGQTVDSFNAGQDPAQPAVGAPVAIAGEAESQLVAGTFYTVQVSQDSGATWETLGSALPSPVVRLLPENYPGVSRVLMRTRTTNGFKTVENIREVVLRQD